MAEFGHHIDRIFVDQNGDFNLNGAAFIGTSMDIMGLFGVTPVGQASKISDPSGGGTVDAEARTAINALIDALEGIGISSV